MFAGGMVFIPAPRFTDAKWVSEANGAGNMRIG
jgi:hypothetical protein